MTRHLPTSEEVEIREEGIAVPLRKHLKFTGADSVADDDANDRSVVTAAAAGGEGPGGYIGYIRYSHGPYTVSNATSNYVNAGSEVENGGDISWLDTDYSGPSTSLWYFQEHGLYRYTLDVTFQATASLGSTSQFGLRAMVFCGTQIYPIDYDVVEGIRIYRSHATDALTTWRARISITDYFGPGDEPGESGIINTQYVKYNSMPAVNDVYTETWIGRIL